MSSGPDSEHDAWLHEALRHAPDAQVVPPASVSELILREAQAKARSATPPAPVPPASAFATFWAWLARPSVAAGAASMMIATVAGVMWWDRPIDEDRGPAIPAAAPAAPAPKAAEQAPELTAAPAPEAKQAQAPAPVVAPSDRALAKGEGVAKKRAAAGGESGGDAERRLNQQAATPPRPFPGTPTDRAPNATTAGIATDTTTAAAAKPAAQVAPPPPMAAPAPAQAPVAAPVTPAPVAAAPMRERSEPAPNATAARRADAPEARSAAAPARMADAAKSADLSRQAFSNTELQKSAGMLAAAAPPTDIAALRQSLAAEPRRWTWQRGGGSPQPVNERLRNWLAQVDSSAAAHWRRVPLTPPAGEQRDALAGSVGPSRELRLLRDGRLAATLRLDGAVLHWESAATEGHAASALQVPLDQNAAQALAQSFP